MPSDDQTTEALPFSDDAARWAAVLARDPAADAAFRYAVRSTGVFCRPTCPARRPLRVNVVFFAGAAEAEAAGFRPCRRCRPNGESPGEAMADRLAAACRLIETSIEAGEGAPELAALAQAAGLSPHHFHRVFKQALGVTPRAYGAAARASRLRQDLPSAASATQACYDAGFGSSGRFYAEAPAALGMTPGAYRNGGAGAEIRFAVGPCSLGEVLVAATEVGVCAILLGDDPDALVRDLERRFANARLIGADGAFETLVAKAVGLVERPAAPVELPLDIRGTAFQRRVWEALRAIPAGQTRSYGEVATGLGVPVAVRAVAGACAANPLAVAIPCHRVVRLGGGLSGYRWGIERKRALLQREADASRGGPPPNP
ncbi:MAG: bifunctional DNA-binding transcriptional regulator/O6-methylguanine-DNA methyltransferase Ada [Pseudoxanthomonas sp.]|nr:bifunctional DNA-binding transcriptional regulator/O6-methylguanine-DNA methyltransferase Ada [Pseudoxanthomonas sp.]